MKQLNFSHFKTNRKLFEAANFFSRKKQKRLPEGQFYFVQYIKDFFGHFTTTPDYSRRFPNSTEDSRRLSKISEYWPRGPTIAKTFEEPSKHLTVFSLETVNIKEIGQLANTNTYGKITLITKPHLDAQIRLNLEFCC